MGTQHTDAHEELVQGVLTGDVSPTDPKVSALRETVMACLICDHTMNAKCDEAQERIDEIRRKATEDPQ